MTTRPVFLRTPYSAYDHREVPREDEELTHVGPGTPCGEYMRRFWQPIAYADELQDLPLAVKILGEERWSSSETRAVGWDVWSCTAPIAAPPWSLG